MTKCCHLTKLARRAWLANELGSLSSWLDAQPVSWAAGAACELDSCSSFLDSWGSYLDEQPSELDSWSRMLVRQLEKLARQLEKLS